MTNKRSGAKAPEITTSTILVRIALSVAAFAALFIFRALYEPQAMLITAQQAGEQFKNSDAAYLKTVYTFSFFRGVGLVASLMFLVALIWIWWKPFAYAIKAASVAAIAILALGAILVATPADAFFEKTDRTEIYPIQPNESAFWIPNVGDTKNTQAEFESESFYNANKIAAKWFVIPHTKLQGSAGTGIFSGYDYFVPTGTLIVVDRSPFSYEWVDAEDRGTAKKKEGFPCQSKEGLNITAGVSIAASVSQANAAKFLYNFGTVQERAQIKGDLANLEADGKIIFASVRRGRSLENVMQDYGRKRVQTLVCAELANRSFDKNNEEANLIMQNVEKAVRKDFEAVGITLVFIGWGDTFEFDPEVQKAVNDRYIAEKLQPNLQVLQALAQLKVQEGLGHGLKTKGLPIITAPGSLDTILYGLMNQNPQSPLRLNPAAQPQR